MTILISNFIFLAYFLEFSTFSYLNKVLEFLSPLLAFFGFYKLLQSKKELYFLTGFFIGILWFYWITFSLIYFHIAYLLPFELLFIALVYAFLFLFAGYFENIYYRIFALFALNFIYPFNFNWLMLDLTLIFGPFKADEFSFLFLLFSLLILIKTKKYYKFFALLPLVFALNFQQVQPKFLPFEIALIEQDRSQFLLWNKEEIIKNIKENLSLIRQASAEKKKVIIFPESSFALFLNKEAFLLEELKELSQEIDIIGGALNYEDGKYYNSTYFFSKSKVQIFNKHVLVPFGEEIPLPTFIKNFINQLIFKADDFSKAENFSDYFLENIEVRNAICYEATRKELYKNSPKFIIAISNNAWFNYTIEPMMQRLIMQKFANKYKVTIYHSANGSRSEIIYPKNGWLAFNFSKGKSK